jgi:hypothetical protein
MHLRSKSSLQNKKNGTHCFSCYFRLVICSSNNYFSTSCTSIRADPMVHLWSYHHFWNSRFLVMSTLGGTIVRHRAQLLLTIFTSPPFIIPLVITHNTTTDPRDIRRVRLCLATASWTPLVLIPIKLGFLSPILQILNFHLCRFPRCEPIPGPQGFCH